MKSIGQICERSLSIASEAKSLHSDVFDYCNKYAQKLLNDKEFEFHELPDPIVEVVFHGGIAPVVGWSSFIKTELKIYLEQNKCLKDS